MPKVTSSQVRRKSRAKAIGFLQKPGTLAKTLGGVGVDELQSSLDHRFKVVNAPSVTGASGGGVAEAVQVLKTFTAFSLASFPL